MKSEILLRNPKSNPEIWDFEISYRIFASVGPLGGTNYAAKEIHPVLLQFAGESEVKEMKKGFLRECYLLSKCLHPKIVQFIGIYYQSVVIPTMVMELMDCNLTTFVERNGSIPLHGALSVLQDVSLGVWYIHSRSPPIMHCDLSPNNVLVNTNSMVAKIADFGNAVEGGEGDVPETLDFMPPEALVERPHYGLPLDVFSYGGVALCAVVGEWPTPSAAVQFDPMTRKRVALSEVERRQQYLDKMIGEADIILLRPLLKECLNNDPTRRPTIEIVSKRITEMKKNYMDRHPETKVISVYYVVLYKNYHDMFFRVKIYVAIYIHFYYEIKPKSKN